MKVDPTDNDVMIHEPNSNDMVQLDRGLGLVKKMDGAQQCIFRNLNILNFLAPTHLRNPHHTDEGDTMLWFAGTSTVRVLDVPTAKVIKEIPDMVPFFNQQEFGIAYRGVHKNRGAQILIAFVISNVFSFSYYEEGLEIDPRLGTQVLPRCNF